MWEVRVVVNLLGMLLREWVAWLVWMGMAGYL
jgi:hypothetical protein